MQRVPHILGRAIALPGSMAGQYCVRALGGNVNWSVKAPGAIEATAVNWRHELVSKVNAVLVAKPSVDDLSGKLKPGAPADLVFEKQRSDAFETSGRQRPCNSA